MMRAPRFQRGFTLIEAIIVISITGVIAAIVSIFIVSPVTGYMTTVRHAQMTDAADASLRRLQREIRLALPNSVRVTDGSSSRIPALARRVTSNSSQPSAERYIGRRETARLAGIFLMSLPIRSVIPSM